MIKTRGLTKYYGKLLALENLNLEIPPGEIFAFLGPNGAGKTTTVKLLSGLLTPTSGTMTLAGSAMTPDSYEAKKFIGLVPDEPYLYPKLTAWEFLELVAGIYELESSWGDAAKQYLELFELSSVLADKTLIESFSHGMKQKLVFTSILMREPKVWLLDEPLVGLDPKAIRIVKELLRQSVKKGASVFLSTHVLTIAEELANRIGIIQAGKLQFVGTLSQLRDCLRQRKLEFHEEETLEDLFLKMTA